MQPFLQRSRRTKRPVRWVYFSQEIALSGLKFKTSTPQFITAPDPDYPVKIALFRAREPLADFLDGMPEYLKNDETWGWRQYSKGTLTMEYIPGDHLTMVTQPHVRQLAQRLHLALSL